MSSLTRTRVIVPPITYVIDGARVTIVEVLDMSLSEWDKMYMVLVQIEWNGYRSDVFPLLVRNNLELLAKLKAEVAKMKLFVRMGYTHVFRRVAS